MKLLSLFSGIGAFEKALKRLNIDYDLIGYSEIDKYASKAYALIHSEPELKNLGDITKIDVSALPSDIDLITYGFPCQDISVAGKTQGFFNNQGEKTRSGLFFNALNIIQATQPKIAIAENVKNLTGKRFKNEFGIVLNSLSLVGYNNYYKVLNAKDYGIPQNRERVFIVSIRKDIDTKNFEFPQPIELNKRLKDLLEDYVDEKYFLAEEKTRGYNDIAPTILGRDYKEPRCVQVGTLDIRGQDIIKRVYSGEGISPTLTNMQGGNRQPKIVASRGRYEIENGEVLKEPLRIRKLTPKECFRLMGFEDEDVDILIKNNISNTQLYKMAGNSICVPMLTAIFRQIMHNSDLGTLLNYPKNFSHIYLLEKM